MRLNRLSLRAAAGGVLGLVLLAAPAAAQQSPADSLRALYRLQLPSNLEAISNVARAMPGSSAGSPSAFGPNWGDGFIGAGYQHQVRYKRHLSARDQMDGSFVTGFGLGNAQKYVGAEVAITSVSTIDSGFYERTAISFKVHRLLPGNVGVAVGFENAVTIGEGLDGGNSIYGVASKVFPRSSWQPFRSVTASVGAGNGRFRFEDDVTADKKTVNAFGSLGIQVIEPASLVADWTGQDLALALSIVPFRSLPLIITPGFADVTGTAGDGARFTLGAGMGFQFSRLPHLLGVR